MALSNFSGNTFVAFVDISGFKELMAENKAIEALNNFYQVGYDILGQQIEINGQKDVQGLFISDCCILFVRNKQIDDNAKLEKILKIIKLLNNKMLDIKIMLTSSIAYGDFYYDERIEFNGIEKNLMLGNAYVNAFLDNESTKQKIPKGHCRLVKKGLPDNFRPTNPLFRERGNHFYYYWNLTNPEDIDKFNRNFKNSPYTGMLNSLKEFER